MAKTPPGYCSGVVLTLREPHLEHFTRLPTEDTGVSPGSDRLRGSMARSRPHSRQYTQSSLPSCKIADRGGFDHFRLCIWAVWMTAANMSRNPAAARPCGRASPWSDYPAQVTGCSRATKVVGPRGENRTLRFTGCLSV